jgi:hypothetical protein
LNPGWVQFFCYLSKACELEGNNECVLVSEIQEYRKLGKSLTVLHPITKKYLRVSYDKKYNFVLEGMKTTGLKCIRRITVAAMIVFIQPGIIVFIDKMLEWFVN